MECPKCGAEIDKGALICPNCKKVLKIICPVCRTVNEKNICKKCGEILVTKCVNCGKINLMSNQNCVKCGYSVELSALKNESNTESFAVIKIEFPNMDVIKTALGTNQLYTKFKANLDKLINRDLMTLGVRRQIIKNNIYLIRFNKVYTFSASANAAIKALIDIVNLITRMNVKLLDRKNISLKCNFTIMRRNDDEDPYNIDTGFKANMLGHSDKKAVKALDSCQVLVDDDFYDIYANNYKLNSLESALVNGRMKRFYEVDIKEFINIDEFINELKQDDDEYSEMGLPNFVQDGLRAQDMIVERTIEEANAIAGEELYNIDLISFDEINCVFYTTENADAMNTLTTILQEVPRGILAIKGANRYQPYTLKLLSTVDGLGIYQNVIPITCYENMKYSPYSFFRELLMSIFDYTVSQKQFSKNDFSIFGGLDAKNLIRDLVCLNQRDMSNLEDTRSEYFQVFLALLKSLPETLIYIENFEMIDSGSKYVLELLFEHFEDLNISYIISYDKEFSLHKDAHFLLARPYYTEITLIPTPFGKIVEANADFYKKIEKDFYFKRIAKYAAGSTLFLDYAIQYLLESEVYRIYDNALEVDTPQTVMIPSSLSQLIKRRLNLMKDDKDAMKLLAMCVLIGPRIDNETFESLDINYRDDVASSLADKGHLYIYNGCIYFPNYNLLKENILDVIDGEDLKEYAAELFNVIYNDNMPSPDKMYLYEKLDEHQKVIFEWEKLANLDLSMGDFASYLNCSGKIIESLDKYANDWTEYELQKYKSELYENIATNMFEYNPDQTRDIADKTLDDLQNSGDEKNFVDLCSKMIQGAIDHGQYIYALSLIHKLLAIMDKSSIDPSSQNFDIKYLLMSLVHIKILFSTGAYNDCVDIGYNVINALDSTKLDGLNSELISKDGLKNMLQETIAYIAIADVLSMREDVSEFLDIVGKLFNFVPKEYGIFVQLQKLIKGDAVSVNESMRGTNVFSNICYYIIRAFVEFKNKPEDFAREVYKAKLVAKDAYIHSLELFVDALIGYSYTLLESYMKASSILYQVVKTSEEKGINAVKHAAWYIMSILAIKQQQHHIAYGILNNSSIQLEMSGSNCEYLTMLNKVNMYKVLKNLGETEKAELCISQAQFIINKYGLNFNLNVDIN